MANVNCLEGMACPKCGSEGPFHITGTATFLVNDDGAGSYLDAEWDGASWCGCADCKQEGIVDDFCKKEDES